VLCSQHSLIHCSSLLHTFKKLGLAPAIFFAKGKQIIFRKERIQPSSWND
jgi:hypothetical protein